MKKTSNAMSEGDVSAAVTAGARPQAAANDMVPVAVATTASAVHKRVEGGRGHAKTAKGKKADSQVLIPFNTMTVSKWNESGGTVLNAARVKDLAHAIRRDGLFRPVILIRHNDPSGPEYAIIKGAHRVEALKRLRGEGSGLRRGEFSFHRRLDENNPKCFDFRMSKNTRHYGRSVIDRARYIQRMLGECHVPLKKLARRLGLNLETMSRLVKLADRFDSLPECWRKDLAYVHVWDGYEPENHGLPRITQAHWIATTYYMGKDDPESWEEIKPLLEMAYTRKFDSRGLHYALQRVRPDDHSWCGNRGTAAVHGAALPAAAVKPATAETTEAKPTA